MNTRDAINTIKSSLNILDFIGDDIRLRGHKFIRGWSGRCPFHEDRSPSFYVYEDTQTYYCFGCHESGDIFTYVMKTQGLDFSSALKLLAEKAGITLNGSHKKLDTDNIQYALNLSQEFYMKTLDGKIGTVAQAYLARRNITIDNMHAYSLGYSPNSWDALLKERAEHTADYRVDLIQ